MQLVDNQGSESHDFIQYAFDGGVLRLYVSRGPSGGDIFALLVDTHARRYADFAQLAPNQRYTVYHHDAYVLVVPLRPVSQELFDQLKARQSSEEELQQYLGAPSYRWHVHGVGNWGLTYVPQGLSFVGDWARPGAAVMYQVFARDIGAQCRKEHDCCDLPPLASLSELDYGKLQLDWLETVASEIFGEREQIDQALANGKRSPGGRFVAAPLNIEGRWYLGEIVIREMGKPEHRYAGASGTQDSDYFWLNSRVCVFKESGAGGEAFHGIDAATGGQQVVTVLSYQNDPDPPHHATDVGVSGPHQFWYKTADGEKHEVRIPSLAPR